MVFDDSNICDQSMFVEGMIKWSDPSVLVQGVSQQFK